MKITEERIIQLSITTGIGNDSLKKEEKEKMIKNYLFDRGQPLIYKENGHRIAEYKDGRKEIIR